jgi:hypothetical protein
VSYPSLQKGGSSLIESDAFCSAPNSFNFAYNDCHKQEDSKDN